MIVSQTSENVEHEKKQSRESKEGKLQEIIASFQLEKSIIYTDETLSRVIFAVNSKTPKYEGLAICRKIMDVIMDEEQAKNISIPIKHHNLELTLKEMVHFRKVPILFKEVYNHVRSFYQKMRNGHTFLNNAFHIKLDDRYRRT